MRESGLPDIDAARSRIQSSLYRDERGHQLSNQLPPRSICPSSIGYLGQ